MIFLHVLIFDFEARRHVRWDSSDKEEQDHFFPIDLLIKGLQTTFVGRWWSKSKEKWEIKGNPGDRPKGEAVTKRESWVRAKEDSYRDAAAGRLRKMRLLNRAGNLVTKVREKAEFLSAFFVSVFINEDVPQTFHSSNKPEAKSRGWIIFTVSENWVADPSNKQHMTQIYRSV